METRTRLASGGKAPPARRALFAALSALCLGAPCCGGGTGGPASQLASLRVVAVTADPPYTEAPEAGGPSGTVTFKLTYADALDSAEDAPRPVQVTWLGGCVNPPGGQYLGCFAQFQGVFQAILSGGMGAEGFFKQEDVLPELSGVPDALTFDMAIPADVLKTAEPTETDAVYSTAYVFFTICAGEVRPPAPPDSLSGFPLECVDKETGAQMHPDSYVAGYSQVFIFSDGRPNTNPPVMGMNFEGEPLAEDPQTAPVVALCKAAEGPAAGCGQNPSGGSSDCESFEIEALVADVAEVDPESSAVADASVKEAVWIDYFADGGSFSGAKKLIHDPRLGYRPNQPTEWTPPPEAGLVSIWAVVHDARGGASVIRRFIRVE